MPYAQIVVALPLEGPFDYELPPDAAGAACGCRALVSFGRKNLLGYIVGVSGRPRVTGKDIKPIRRLVDRTPVLDQTLLRLTQAVSRYYCCSWGITIESALPSSFRLVRSVLPAQPEVPLVRPGTRHPSLTLLHDPSRLGRWDVYAEMIRDVRSRGKSVLFLCPDFEHMRQAVDLLHKRIGEDPIIVRRGAADESSQWLKIRSAASCVVVGTRSAVFSPARDLGLIIVDEEQNEGYKQEQPPHYHSRIVALMRRRIEKCDCVLGSVFPSLESYRLKRFVKARYLRLESPLPALQTAMIDMRAEYSRIGRKAGIVTQYLQDTIAAAFAEKGKVLLFINRVGFSTLAACTKCGEVLTCPHCSSNLIYHYRQGTLSCRYCSFSLAKPQACPQCGSGYLQYRGTGTERVESELSRLFPAARIEIVASGRPLAQIPADADIYVATSLIMKLQDFRFALTAVLSLDDTLNRVDFRGGEKAAALLYSLAALTTGKLFIQSYFPEHRSFRPLLTGDPESFYRDELSERKHLKLSPYRHHICLRVRGGKENRVREASENLGASIRDEGRKRRVPLEMVGVFPARPPKVRGKFHWQVLVGCRSVVPVCSFLREIVRTVPRSGIIIAVDVDPV